MLKNGNHALTFGVKTCISKVEVKTINVLPVNINFKKKS